MKVELLQRTAQIQEQLMLTKLDEAQVAMIKNRAADIEDNVDPNLKLNWRRLVSFGGREQS